MWTCDGTSEGVSSCVTEFIERGEDRRICPRRLCGDAGVENMWTGKALSTILLLAV